MGVKNEQNFKFSTAMTPQVQGPEFSTKKYKYEAQINRDDARMPQSSNTRQRGQKGVPGILHC